MATGEGLMIRKQAEAIQGSSWSWCLPCMKKAKAEPVEAQAASKEVSEVAKTPEPVLTKEELQAKAETAHIELEVLETDLKKLGSLISQHENGIKGYHTLIGDLKIVSKEDVETLQEYQLKQSDLATTLQDLHLQKKELTYEIAAKKEELAGLEKKQKDNHKKTIKKVEEIFPELGPVLREGRLERANGSAIPYIKYVKDDGLEIILIDFKGTLLPKTPNEPSNSLFSLGSLTKSSNSEASKDGEEVVALDVRVVEVIESRAQSKDLSVSSSEGLSTASSSLTSSLSSSASRTSQKA